MNADNTIRAVDHPLTILIPIYNDWEALDPLLGLIDRTLSEHGLKAGVLVLDDGSTIDAPPSSPAAWNGGQAFAALPRIDLLPLKRNLGHQRAIAIGIAYVEHRGTCEELVVMDGDGEDDPDDIPRLIARSRAEGGRSIVFAERTRRSESLVFQAFYILYKGLHRALTGGRVQVGNFSLIPRSRLASLSVVSELWIHYAAGAFRSRQPVSLLPTRRAKRLRGDPRMNFVGLVLHGLSAISVNGDLMGVRLLIALAVLGLVDLAASAATLLERPGIEPGPTLSSLGIMASLGLFLMNMTAMTAGFLFLMLNRRLASGFLPKRDHVFYIETIRPLVASSQKPERSQAARPAWKTREFRHDRSGGD